MTDENILSAHEAKTQRDGGAVGPFVVPAGDVLWPMVQRAVARIPLGGTAHAINIRDHGRVTMQSTKRPKVAPEWAWGYTPRPAGCWVNPTISAIEQQYSTLHEWGHTLDDRFFYNGVHVSILQRMGVELGWNQGFYTAHSSNVPREGFADAFARAISGGAFGHVLKGFYQSNIKPTDYGWLLDVVAEAMGI